MTPRTKPQYDDHEARLMLADLTRDLPFHSEARKKAARQLVEEFGELAAEYGVEFQNVNSMFQGADLALKVVPTPGHSGVFVTVRNEVVAVQTQEELHNYRPPIALSLRFNPTEKRFEALLADKADALAPGSPPHHRSALAVLAEVVLGRPKK